MTAAAMFSPGLCRNDGGWHWKLLRDVAHHVLSQSWPGQATLSKPQGREIHLTN